MGDYADGTPYGGHPGHRLIVQADEGISETMSETFCIYRHGCRRQKECATEQRCTAKPGDPAKGVPFDPVDSYAEELHDLLGKARSGLALVIGETGLGELFLKQVDAALAKNPAAVAQGSPPEDGSPSSGAAVAGPLSLHAIGRDTAALREVAEKLLQMQPDMEHANIDALDPPEPREDLCAEVYVPWLHELGAAIMAYVESPATNQCKETSMLDLYAHEEKSRLSKFLDGVVITSENIGDIRRSLLHPFETPWNGWVRDLTAERENKSHAQGGTTERPFAHDPANPGINKGNEGPRF